MPGASPNRNSSNSNMLLLVRLVRSSISRMVDLFMAGSLQNKREELGRDGNPIRGPMAAVWGTRSV
ncbi:MAG: hypothetical protein OHK0048_18910 [Rhodoferax sp.]